MAQPATREVSGEPATLPLYVKAALPVLPGVSLLPGIRKTGQALPDLTLTRHDVPIRRDHVTAYAGVCGFRMRDAVPVTYPHVLAFPLHLALMTDADFPFPAIGLVHVENSITQHRAISADEALQVTARAERLRAHPKGQVFDIVTRVHSAGELVWEETSSMLRRGGVSGAADADQGRELALVPPSGPVWRVPGDLGRAYAGVSGDRNPIHLYALTAKALGFPRQIAHGMWSKARCIAALEGRLPEAVRVDVVFKKPVVLPGKVAFGSRRGDHGDYEFSLTSPRSGAPHLLGRGAPA